MRMMWQTHCTDSNSPSGHHTFIDAGRKVTCTIAVHMHAACIGLDCKNGWSNSYIPDISCIAVIVVLLAGCKSARLLCLLYRPIHSMHGGAQMTNGL